MLAHAQSTETPQGSTQLVLPTSQDDFRKLNKPQRSGPCVKCGVVANIREKQTEVKPATPTPTPGGPQLVGTPIIGSKDVVEDARKPFKHTSTYVITVRYDNNTYAFIEQSDKPSLRKGDKVEVINDRVEFVASGASRQN